MLCKNRSVLSLLVLLFINESWAGIQNVYPKIPSIESKTDAGSPLILTPLIEAGQIDEAQNQSFVDFSEFGNVKSYSGYLTVDKKYDSNLFFWYFPNEQINDAPVVLWLQGGPGSSSLYGLFVENGPLAVVNNVIQFRNESWAQFASLLYIDNPVGTGYSYTNNEKGYRSTEDEIGDDLYNALVQFFTLFPNLQDKKFFVTGESYAGKYVPAVSYKIHVNNPTADLKIPFEGMAIGDGYSDPVHQQDYADYIYELGLIDIHEKERLTSLQNQTIQLAEEEKWLEASFSSEKVTAAVQLSTGLTQLYNYVKDPDNSDDSWGTYIQRSDVREAIHVGNTQYKDGSQLVYNHLQGDMMKSVAPWVSELLSHYPVLIYSGQLDIIVAYPLTLNYLQHLDFDAADEYAVAKREFWHVDKILAGYKKKAGNLTEVLVRDAGHMVPRDQPKWALSLIQEFISGEL